MVVPLTNFVLRVLGMSGISETCFAALNEYCSGAKRA